MVLIGVHGGSTGGVHALDLSLGLHHTVPVIMCGSARVSLSRYVAHLGRIIWLTFGALRRGQFEVGMRFETPFGPEIGLLIADLKVRPALLNPQPHDGSRPPDARGLHPSEPNSAIKVSQIIRTFTH